MPQCLRCLVSEAGGGTSSWGLFHIVHFSVHTWVLSELFCWTMRQPQAGPWGSPSKQLATVAVPSQVPASNVLVTSLVSVLSRAVDTILVMLIGE